MPHMILSSMASRGIAIVPSVEQGGAITCNVGNSEFFFLEQRAEKLAQ